MNHTNIDYSRINSYLDERMNFKERLEFEKLISSNDEYKIILDEHKAKKEFILNLMPEVKIKKSELTSINNELRDITESILDHGKERPLKRIYKFLTKPVLEF